MGQGAFAVQCVDLLIERMAVLLARLTFTFWFARDLAHCVWVREAIKRAHVPLPGTPMDVPTPLECVDVLAGFQINPGQEEVELDGAFVLVAYPHAGPCIRWLAREGKSFKGVHDLLLHFRGRAFICAEVDDAGCVTPFAPVAVNQARDQVHVTTGEFGNDATLIAFVISIREEILDWTGGVRDACVEHVDDHRRSFSNWRWIASTVVRIA